MSRILTLFLIGVVLLYKKAISPFLPMRCRFFPTCSSYMIEALKTHGPFKGLVLGLKRIGKCHPWGGHGIDLVPEKSNKG